MFEKKLFFPVFDHKFFVYDYVFDAVVRYSLYDSV